LNREDELACGEADRISFAWHLSTAPFAER
jgi:hypothetical protein